MSEINIKPFNEGVQKCLDNLNVKNMKSILLKGANIITKEAKQIAKRKIKSSTLHYYVTKKSNKAKSYSIDSGIKSTKYKKSSNYSNEAVAASHIMGDFRLKFFEKGTDARFTKDGKRRGSISSTKYRFFSTATTNKEEAAYDVIEQELNKLIVL